MVLTNIKTPGVYIDEISLFPPSVVQVATAIPAFIGYTQSAKNLQGKTITEPVKIKSLLEFTTYFGGPYSPENYNVKVNTTTLGIDSAQADKRFYMYDSLRQFYDNGGGDCYVVSVGNYEGIITSSEIDKGLDQIKKFDEPTIIAFPDAVELLDGDDKPDYDSIAGLQKKALALCASLQDRFAVLDLMQGNFEESAANDTTPISSFRDKIGVNFLNYGAVYYPWVKTSYGVDVSFRKLKFTDTNDVVITDYSPFSKNANEADLVTLLQKKNTESTDILKGISTILPAGSDQILSNSGDAKKVITDYLDGLEKEITAGNQVKENLTKYLDLLAVIAGSFSEMEGKVAADSALKPEIATLKTDSKLVNSLKSLAVTEKNPTVIKNNVATRDADKIKDIYKSLDNGWLGTGITFDTLPADSTPAYEETAASTLSIISDLKSDEIQNLLTGFEKLIKAAAFYQNQAEKNLFANHTFFKGVADRITETMRTIPPSGAVAGVYAQVDRTKGVWKAPANISLNSVLGPAVKIDNHDQESLNVHDSGKSINAIRAFTGRGTLVWGARTLAGNDNEWRYIPVRRFFIMVEESVKKATEPFVFENNDANTWIKVKVMIENFLTLQWRAGALQGAKPENAFFVNVGFGPTMSETDLLEGRMIVEIGMAVVRPAEFIILRFSHKMMEK